MEPTLTEIYLQQIQNNTLSASETLTAALTLMMYIGVVLIAYAICSCIQRGMKH